MELVHYITGSWQKILWLTWQHVTIVGVAVGLAIITGIPIGIAAAQNRRIASVALYTASIIMTIPSMALFGVLIPILALINRGIGYVPAVIAVFLYSQLPIISNTYAAFRSIDPALREAAQGMGMTRMQRLRLVEAPLVLPVIIAGVRTAIVLNIGIAAIAAYIGAGGLGLLIRSGITQTDTRQILAGAIAVSVLALVADRLFALLQRRLTSPGLAPA
jgi:osmoprotectant transport system permease protein